ncbi:hypothetical protein SK128_023535, partial [Halocaridina rubra]
VKSDLLQGVEVPQYAFSGGRVNVTCKYDLRATGLYSLKWYHNDTEFYRYVPTETQTPVDIKRNMKFQAHEFPSEYEFQTNNTMRRQKVYGKKIRNT